MSKETPFIFALTKNMLRAMRCSSHKLCSKIPTDPGVNITRFHQLNVVLGEPPFYGARSTVLVVGDAVPQQCRDVGLILRTMGGAKMGTAAVG